MDLKIWESGAGATPPTPPAAPSNGWPVPGNPIGPVAATKGGSYWHYQIAASFTNFFDAVGVTPDHLDLTLLTKAVFAAIELKIGGYALDTGLVNAYVVALDPPLSAYHDGLSITFRTSHPNTGASTLDAGDGTRPLRRDDNTDVQGGDIPSGVITATYSLAADAFLINSTVPSQATQASAIEKVTASIAANALTLNYQGGVLDFRDPTPSSGAVHRAVVPAGSIVIPNGATLGAVNGQSSRLIHLIAYNGGAPVNCIVNLSGGVNLDETTLISPTTISAGATSASTIYSASAVSANSPFRVVAAYDVNEPAAGVYSVAPTKVQGAGGVALSNLSSLGFGQAYTSQTGNRTSGVTNYNTTGRPIIFHCSMSGTALASASLTIDSIVIPVTSIGANGGSSAGNVTVLPGKAYTLTVSGSGISSIAFWEVR